MSSCSWRRLFFLWLFELVFLFTGSCLLFAWLGPSANIRQAAWIALATSSAFILPVVLSKLTPVWERRPGRPGFATKDESWLCYAVLLEAAYGLAFAVMAPAWEWRMLGVAGAVGGILMAGAIWTGRLPIRLRR